MLRRLLLPCLALLFCSVGPGSAQPTSPALGPKSDRVVGGGCDGCEAIYAGLPASVGSETTIAPEAEPGERMEIRGVVFQRDGKTPAPKVLLYFWHTDVTGHYVPAPEQTGLARRHGKLRGWVRTNERGEYKFQSIRPAAYPGRTVPAHVHVVVKESDKNEYYLDDFLFDDDPILTAEQRARLENRGGSGVMKMSRKDGVWQGRRDIVLGQNIPNY